MFIFPVFVSEGLCGLLSVIPADDGWNADGDLHFIRQIADRLGVGWSHFNMVWNLRKMTIGSMRALARAVDAKSPWTAGHSSRVMRIALGIGQQIGIEGENREKLKQAALLHDIGKIGISSAILDKPGKLTDEEYETIKSHPAIGADILGPISSFDEIIPIVRQHHERWDGKGYPDGLAGNEICPEARILAVADVYDAMVSDRPYRKGMEKARAIAIIQSESGKQFDPMMVRLFLKWVGENQALAA